MRLWRSVTLALGLLFAAGPAVLAQQDAAVPRSPVLVVDTEQLFGRSGLGAQIARQIEAEASALAAENRRIEAELAEEEKALTARRAEMPAAEFRELADRFDEKVTRIRNEQQQKARTFGADSDAARREFLVSAQPALEAIMREAGAAVVLDRRTTFLSVDSVDITEEAVRRIDAAAGLETPAEGDPEGGPATPGTPSAIPAPPFNAPVLPGTAEPPQPGPTPRPTQDNAPDGETGSATE
ncbi:OmpH family outer membrane protein [Pseudooceanicola aestuarii]|uniref:OmpH family outer membrane protein n=1 Tax=Pseudooceanicola aestuarii TaxID=2697319 RepID=UPI0013D0DFDE|nr:OmpH family outer membrane protein [Pseudooceanicola aestuarii]